MHSQQRSGAELVSDIKTWICGNICKERSQPRTLSAALAHSVSHGLEFNPGGGLGVENRRPEW